MGRGKVGTVRTGTAGRGWERRCASARGAGCAALPRRRAQGERCSPALAVQRWQPALPSAAAAALPRPSQLASAARREGQDLFPEEGGSRARAAPARVVWGRGEEGAGTALCRCPPGGAGRSQSDGPGISCVWPLGLECTVCLEEKWLFSYMREELRKHKRSLIICINYGKKRDILKAFCKITMVNKNFDRGKDFHPSTPTQVGQGT
ncbi:uncharacterized protein LOC128782244 [Vidua chalybeata]|uniref:uncharacterized protein LOC128782244 n=1 Tax=Vidua chalybeata TaxID=81927 RepID=UPI0023A89D00|nr:uncharacterized protein LOC128782244 [Vidua chalybeata]